MCIDSRCELNHNNNNHINTTPHIAGSCKRAIYIVCIILNTLYIMVQRKATRVHGVMGDDHRGASRVLSVLAVTEGRFTM